MAKNVAHKLRGTFAGLTILEELSPNEYGTPQAFRVRYLCCNAEAVISSTQVTWRRANGAKGCRRCASKKTIKKARPQRVCHTPDVAGADYGVKPPSWPVPRQALIGAHVPFYDRAAA